MGPRTEEVRSPSGREETLAVLQTAVVVALVTLVVIGAERPHVPRGEAGMVATLRPAPDEVAFGDLPAADQRMFRQLQEGVLEAENVRARTGTWPSVATLRDQGIPPFASDPIDRAGYVWTLARRGPVANYAGTPRPGAGRLGFLVLIVEPDPGTPDDPSALPDELHHRLPGGPMIHVSIWLVPAAGEPSEPVAFAPVERGWRRVTVAAP